MLERYTRTILFAKPELVVIYDRLTALHPATFQYWLHAANKFEIDGQRNIKVRAGDVICDVDFLSPEGLSFSQSDQYDPNPEEPRITLREWHLTASTPAKARSVEFVVNVRQNT